MCLIIRKPAGRLIPSDFLENAWQRNSHGWGAFQLDAGAVVWERGLELADLLAYNAGLPADAEVYLHVRRATYGDVSEQMTHPYRIRDGLMLMHNGSIHHLAPADKSISDSAELARMIDDLLGGLDAEQSAALIRSEGFRRLTAPLIDGSMVILIDYLGALRFGRQWHTVQVTEWDGAMPGVEVSNTHAWTPKPLAAGRLPAWRQWLATIRACWPAARRAVA